ncbi:MAG: TonB family protein [Terracidiphilus sp.]
MNSLLDGGEQLERELAPEPMMAPAAGSLLLHLALAACLLTYGLVAGLFHHNQWGNAGSGGAIQVSLTSALPLPSDQPPNENVLATDTPSQAPAESTPKAKQAIDETAIPIAGKRKQQQQENARKAAQHQAELDKRAQYGEQAGSSMPRSVSAQNGTNGPVSISSGDFGSRFGWYVEGIERKMTSSWNRYEVDQRTVKGMKSYIQFTIHRDGSVSNIRLDQSSGSQTLDSSCLRAAQRVDTFGALPAQYNESTVMTSYYCEY